MISIVALRITALAALVVFGYFFIQLMLTRTPELGYYALASLGAFIALRFVAFVKARHLTCQLCHGTVMQANTCHKHRDAHRIPLLGYFWTAALDVVTKAGFRCMYCGTAYRLKK